MFVRLHYWEEPGKDLSMMRLGLLSTAPQPGDAGGQPTRSPDRARLLGFTALTPPAAPYGQGRFAWRVFLWHWRAMAFLAAPSVGTMRLFGVVDERAGIGALVGVSIVSLLRTLIGTSVAQPPAPMPSPEFGLGVLGEERAANTPSTTAESPLATCKVFDDAVRRALTHLLDPTKLVTSPLLRLALVSKTIHDQQLEDTRLNRAAALKSILIALLTELRPQGQDGGPTSGAWRFYNCLYYPYVRGISRRRAPTVLRALVERREREGSPRTEQEQVIRWLLQVDEDTYYKWQRRGSDTIAAALRDQERAAGGEAPIEPVLRQAPHTSKTATSMAPDLPPNEELCA
jgi:hypothetical protein